MSVNNFKPEIWSAALQAQLRKRLVARSIASTRWQGEITGQGSVVNIQKPAGLTAADYTGTVTYETPTSTTLALAIDQAKYVAFSVDDVDAVQANVDLVAAYSEDAAYRLARLADTYVMSLASSAALDAHEVAVNLSDASPANWDSMYEALSTAAENLDVADAPTDGRFAVVSPRMMSAVRHDSTFVAASDLGDLVKVSGSIGRIAGFDIVPSNNVATEVLAGTTPGSADLALYGVAGSIAYAEQLMDFEALRAQTAFADNVRGLHVFGAKILEPSALGRIQATTVAPVA